MRACLFCSVLVFVLASPCLADYMITNGGFESAQIVSNDPTFGFLDWNLAVPGWGHSPGPDSDGVYYGSTHIGFSSWFLLLDQNSTIIGQPLAGDYSLAIKSDYEAGGPTYLSQTCTVPTGAGVISLLARKGGDEEFYVRFKGQSIPMYPQGGDRFLGNIASFAGQTGELKIVIDRPSSPEWEEGFVILDDIKFAEGTVVPEPMTLGFLASGFGMLLALLRRRR